MSKFSLFYSLWQHLKILGRSLNLILIIVLVEIFEIIRQAGRQTLFVSYFFFNDVDVDV